MIWPTVTFWYSLRTSGNANDELLAKIALCHVTLLCLYHGYVSRLIQKCFEQKFLYIFVDVWSLHKCFCVYSFDRSAE